jgi:HK97 family phage portal protein
VGLLERIQADRAEKRAITGVPWRPWDNPFIKFNLGGPVHPSRAAYGQDQALGLPALYSCTRLLAESLASLPLKLYTSPPGSDVTTRYTGPSLFDQPSADTDVTLYDWLYQMMTALLLHGNAWGLISGRDGYGYPTGIEWIPPERVYVQEDSQQPWNPMRTRVYVDGRLFPDWRSDLFHVRGYALAGRTEGLSPLRAFALTVLSGIESQKYGADWYLNGGFPSGVFQNQELEVSLEDAREIRESLMEAIHGHKPLVVGRDWDYKPVSVPPSEAQFLEATQMNATQVAAVYGLPPDRVGGRRGDSLTYNTVEQSTLQVIEALRPWIVRLETAFFRLLPQSRFCRFNSDALLKTDLKTRTEIYAQQRAIGMLTVDEIRDMEDRMPYPNATGDEKIPQDVMVAMSRSIRGIPNSMLPSITLEVDLIADRLTKLQGEGLTKPETEPSIPNPEDFLSGQVGSVRSAAGAPPLPHAMLAHLQALLAEHVGREAAAQILDKSLATAGADRKQPEFIGPWIPSEADLAKAEAVLRLAAFPVPELASANGGNGNGNGRH